MEAVTIYPCVYVLSLEDECWYIGITLNLNVRMAQHWSGKGAKWTKLHTPKRICEVFYPGTRELENEVTKRYIEQYGREKVCGGSWCKLMNSGTSEASGSASDS
jgi:predicted GIY-YIG superfamily endonuclease